MKCLDAIMRKYLPWERQAVVLFLTIISLIWIGTINIHNSLIILIFVKITLNSNIQVVLWVLFQLHVVSDEEPVPCSLDSLLNFLLLGL